MQREMNEEVWTGKWMRKRKESIDMHGTSNDKIPDQKFTTVDEEMRSTKLLENLENKTMQLKFYCNTEHMPLP